MKRPVFLNLFQIKFPLTAMVSITHRVTGVVIFFAIPYCLYLLEMSLTSSGWKNLHEHVLQQGCNKFFLWIVFSAVSFHIVAGIRHFIMDVGFLEKKYSAFITSHICIWLSVLISIWFGVFIW